MLASRRYNPSQFSNSASFESWLRVFSTGHFAGATLHFDISNDTYLHNWHIDLIAAKLNEVRTGKCKRLIINIPPRYMKSICASVAFPAWLLGHDPSINIICASYDQDLAEKLAMDSRNIMQTSWYQEIFPNTRIPKS